MTFILFLLYCRRYAMRKGGGIEKAGTTDATRLSKIGFPIRQLSPIY